MKSSSKHNVTQFVSLLICLFLTQAIYASGVSVVVNPDSSLENVKKNEIKKLFLGKTKKIAGESLKPIDNARGETRKKFLKKVVGKKPRSFKSYWTRLIFSGRAAPLKSGNNDEEVKKMVNGNKNSIGFIDSDNVDDKVKVIYTVK